LATDEPISFAQDIKPLFRARDRPVDEVRLRDEQIAAFQGWVKAGAPG
jgi:hypothetical protein